MEDTKTQDAVCKRLEEIGENAKGLPDTLLDQYSSDKVPWKRIKGMREVMVHDYGHIEMEIVWEVVKSHLTPLQKTVEQMLEDP